MARTQNITAEDLGLHYATNIQRKADIKTWPSEIEAIEDPEVRAVAEKYLRGIAARMRVVIDISKGRR